MLLSSGYIAGGTLCGLLVSFLKMGAAASVLWLSKDTFEKTLNLGEQLGGEEYGQGELALAKLISLAAFAVLGLLLGMAPQVAQQWERAVVLRMGRFIGLRGPGLFWRIPFVDSVTAWVDQRVITTAFAAEETLTSDTVPVNVDAVLFWLVHDASGWKSDCVRSPNQCGRTPWRSPPPGATVETSCCPLNDPDRVLGPDPARKRV